MEKEHSPKLPIEHLRVWRKGCGIMRKKKKKVDRRQRYNIYIGDYVTDEVLEWLNKQNNMTRAIFEALDEYLKLVKKQETLDKIERLLLAKIQQDEAAAAETKDVEPKIKTEDIEKEVKSTPEETNTISQETVISTPLSNKEKRKKIRKQFVVNSSNNSRRNRRPDISGEGAKILVNESL
ncbi:MAG: hypothetical protein H0Z24_03365 [Thermosipho sp. (in: Bacteria)]|nr:hypothetical protein [Thermosipho sp. (in: thermotogales)]